MKRPKINESDRFIIFLYQNGVTWSTWLNFRVELKILRWELLRLIKSLK